MLNDYFILTLQQTFIETKTTWKKETRPCMNFGQQGGFLKFHFCPNCRYQQPIPTDLVKPLVEYDHEGGKLFIFS